ncbi:MAG: hypothetical protein JO131_04865 [Gammaproteobacteria bacterium]|nr:hypothetical protein [Gammaproteobacteria bacterium]
MDLQLKKIILANLDDPKLSETLDLSKEELVSEDYYFIEDILKKSSYILTLKLPHISDENVSRLLDVLNKATRNNSVLTNIIFHSPISLEKQSTHSQHLYQQIQSRLTRNKNRIFGIHGGGNIGLGVMADIVSKSPFTYQSIATTNDNLIKTLINARQQFQLQHDLNQNQVTTVKKIRMISRDKMDVIKLYEEANILAICLTPGILSLSSKEIAQGLINRFRIDGSGLKILLLMNLAKCDEFVRKEVSKEIHVLAKNNEEAQEIINRLELIPTVIDRIVTKIPEEKIKNQIRQQLILLYRYEHEDSQTLAKRIDDILSNPIKLAEIVKKYNIQFNLFNAEFKFAHYVSLSPVIKRFPGLRTVNNLNEIEVIKNRFINGPHAILAWLGALHGRSTIAEAINHPGLLQLINNIMTLEIGPALKAEFNSITDHELEFQKNLFIARCKESKDDPIWRVARDPLRKLNANGRIRGTIALCNKHNIQSTPGLELGFAAAILYALKNFDRHNVECVKIREIFNVRKSYKDILCFNGTYATGKFQGLDPIQDKILIEKVTNKIMFLTLNFQYQNQASSPFRLFHAQVKNEQDQAYSTSQHNSFSIQKRYAKL